MTHTKCTVCQHSLRPEEIKEFSVLGLCENCWNKLFDQDYDGLINELKTVEEQQ